MTDENDFNRLVACLRNARRRDNEKCVLLLGAGCSRSAGIPLAEEIPDKTNEFNESTKNAFAVMTKEYERLSPRERERKSKYQLYMKEMEELDRVEVFREYLEKAKMTWGYLAVSQLIYEKYVDRILTTNFDRLLIRACSYNEQFPAVYDVSTSLKMKKNNLSYPEIYYLHGQYPGFRILSIDEEFQENYDKLIKQVLHSVGSVRTWIVAGYSGVADKLVDHLIEELDPGHGFFWLNYVNPKYPQNEAQKAVLERIKSIHAHIIDIDDFDQFFIKLGQKLECFPPAFVSEPFVSIKERVEKFADFPGKKEESSEEVDSGFLQEFRERLNYAIEKDEARKRGEKNKNTIWNLYLEGKYEEMIAIAEKLPEPDRMKFKEPLSSAYFSRAYNHQTALEGKKPTEADFLFIRNNYEQAAKYNPKSEVILNNLGTTLYEQAELMQGTEADSLFEESCQKFAQAIRMKPKYFSAFNNWGNALSNQAKTKHRTEADELFEESYRKYAEATRLKPEDPDVYNNWGWTLFAQAKTKQGVEADTLFEESYRKFNEAIQLRPEYLKAINNWVWALTEQAKTKMGVEADKLFEESYLKFAEATRLKPEDPDVYNNWGSSLFVHAKTKQGTEADALFEESYRKYAEATRLKPEYPDAFSNWGSALSSQAITKQGAEADTLFEECYRKFSEAIRLKSEYPDVFNNWGWVYTWQARTKSGEEADRLFDEAYKKYAIAVQLKSDNSSAFCNWGWALNEQSMKKSGDEAERLFQDAITKCRKAEELNDGGGSYNLGCIYSLRNNKEEARKWLEKSLEKGFSESRSYMEKDADLDNVQNEPWFQELLAKTKP